MGERQGHQAPAHVLRRPALAVSQHPSVGRGGIFLRRAQRRKLATRQSTRREKWDPDAFIKQPYTSAKPSGGFLHIAIVRADNGAPQLRITFHNATGRALYEVITPS